MPTVREIMTPNPHLIRASDTVTTVAQRMAELGVGALPICGEDDTLAGIVTDRDIVVKVLAANKDPLAVHAGELADGRPVTVGADDSTEDVLRLMTEHQVRRLPVIDGHEVVGMVTQADVARSLPDAPVGSLVEALSVDA